MSLSIDFEAHSWYMSFAISNNFGTLDHLQMGKEWYGVGENGMAGYLVEFTAPTLDQLKINIRTYRNGKTLQ